MPFNPEGLALSEDYARTMHDEVLPRNAARRRERVIEGDGGRPLYTVSYDADAPRGTVLIVHGFTENADKIRRGHPFPAVQRVFRGRL